MYSALTHNVTLFEKLISNEPGIASKFCLQIWTFQEGLYQTSLFRKRRFLVIFPSFSGLGQAKMRNTQELKPTVSSQKWSKLNSNFRSARFGASFVVDPKFQPPASSSSSSPSGNWLAQFEPLCCKSQPGGCNVMRECTIVAGWVTS